MAGFRKVDSIVPTPQALPPIPQQAIPSLTLPSTSSTSSSILGAGYGQILSNPEGDYKYIPPDPYVPPAEPTPPVLGDGLGGKYGYGTIGGDPDFGGPLRDVVTNTKIAEGPNKNGRVDEQDGKWIWFNEDHSTPVQSDGESDGGYINNERSVTNRGNQMNGLIMKKMTQKDKHGNMISFEFEVPPMNEIPKPETSFPGGPKGTDTVPTWLTPGENVVNAEASRLYQPMLDQMNNVGRAIQAQQGGPIPDYASSGKEVPQYHAMGSISDELNSNENMTKYLEQAEFNKKYLADNQISHLAGGAEVDNKIPGPYDWITENVLDGLAITESGGRHTDSEGNLVENLRSGAIGKYQWKPSSAAKPGYEVQPFDVTDEEAQRKASYEYLKGIQKYNPDFTQAQVLQSFNAGPGRMRNYVDNIGRPDAITNAGLTTETFEYPDKVFAAAGQPNWDGARTIPVVYNGNPSNQIDQLTYDVPELDGTIPPPGKASNIMPELTDVSPGHAMFNNKPTVKEGMTDAYMNQGLGEEDLGPYLGENSGQGDSAFSVPALTGIPSGHAMFQPENKPTVKEGMTDAYMNQGLEGEDLTGPYLGENSGQGDLAFDYQDKLAKYKNENKEAFAVGNDRDKARKFKEFTHKAMNLRKELEFLDPVEDAAEYNSVSALLAQAEAKASKFTESAAVVAEVEKQDNANKLIEQNKTEIKVLENNKKNVTDLTILAKINKKISDLKVENKDKAKETTYTIEEEDKYSDKDFGMYTGTKQFQEKIIKKALPNVNALNTKNKKEVIKNEKTNTLLKEIIARTNAYNVSKTTTEESTKKALKLKNEKDKGKSLNQSKGFFAELFGDLIDTKELARMAVMYAGSRALGNSHEGSLGFAAVNYIKRIDTKAANREKTALTLIAKGKHTTASIAAYKKSGDENDLILVGAPINSTGKDKYLFHPILKKKVLVREFKQNDNVYWSADGGKSPVSGEWTSDGTAVRGSKDFRDYTSKAIPILDKILKDDKKQYDKDKVTSKDGIVTKTTYKTDINITQAAGESAKWAAENGLAVDEMGTIVSAAYRMAIEQSGGDNNRRPKSLIPYLNFMKIRKDTQVPDLFARKDSTAAKPVPMEVSQVNTLSTLYLAKMNRPNQTPSEGNNRDILNIFWQGAAKIWAQRLTDNPELLQQYKDKALKDQSPFYVFAKEELDKLN
tara:strand:- start:1583 stop:5143 length:3561 start_codon:yes stop_codon:yes gene_type:complete